MKKTAYTIALSLAIMAGACTGSDTIGHHSDIVVRVSTDGAASRTVAAVPGYTLKCVMQLFADDGVAVGQRAVMDASEGTADFVLHAKDMDNGATRAAFWAEYVPDDEFANPKIYNSDDLSAIRYNVTAFDATDEVMMAAADAFAGVLTELRQGATLTLRRPMIRLNFSPKNSEAAAGAKALTVSYDAPSAYSVVDATSPADTYQSVTVTDASFDPEQTPWFSTLIPAPSNMSTLDRPMTIAISGRVDQRMTIPAKSIPLDANHIVNATAEISREQTQDLTVEVKVDGEYTNDPDKNVEMTVGCYINAKGRATLDRYSAVGIVFYMGTISGDNISLYPEEYAGKKIRGYAVAIENVRPQRAQFNATTIAPLPPNEKIVNGTQNSAAVLAALGESVFAASWQQWTDEHKMEAGLNTTPWYLPSRNQMEEWMAMILPTYGLNNKLIDGTPTGSTDFRALFPMSSIYDRDPLASCMYATCSVNNNGNVQGCNMQINPCSVKFSQIDVQTKTQSVLGRPMITIFE